MEATHILLIPATIIVSVVLVVSCLSFKRFKKRNESGPDKNKSGKKKRDENRQINGLTNTAFTVGNSDPDIYENEENTYDYAKNERGIDPKLWRKSTGTDQDKHPDLSPLYADANDTNTRFYFTLERNPTGKADINNKDDDSYVIVIPDENIYDKPEDDTTADDNLRVDTNEGGSQFYHTLEECCEQTGEENREGKECQNVKQHEVSIEIEEQDEMNDEGTYVITITNEVDGKENETSGEDTESKRDEIQTENEHMEQVCIDNISNYENDSSKMNDDEDSQQIGMEEGNAYLGQFGAEEDNVGTQQRINSESKEDELGQHVDIYESEKIYENVNACLSESNNDLAADSSSVNISEKNITTVDSQDNLGYLDEETLTQNKTNFSPRQSETDDENTYVIQIETTASDSNDCSSKNTTRNDQHYVDGDIYEDWEDNIIGRGTIVSGESGDDLNEFGEDEINRFGDEEYQNKFDIANEQDQSSRCESFYQNLNVYKPPLVMQR